jgi:purine-nucleoside phosphorylase
MITDTAYSAAARSAAALARRTGKPAHDVAVILGSGWAAAADALGPPDAEVPLADLGGFPAPSVAGHAPAVRSVAIEGRHALVFLGRVHLYEGHSPAAVAHAVRTAVAAGCRVVVLTNAAGGIREDYRVGQLVLIRDHLNLTGHSPLAGAAPPDGFGSRFNDLTDLYSERLRAVALDAEPSLTEGVYAALPGPHYETPAEIRMLRALGADLVGMSTALEAIAASHLGAKVLAISLVTNPAAGVKPAGQAAPSEVPAPSEAAASSEVAAPSEVAATPASMATPAPVDHDAVIAAGEAAADRLGALLARILPRLLPQDDTA